MLTRSHWRSLEPRWRLREFEMKGSCNLSDLKEQAWGDAPTSYRNCCHTGKHKLDPYEPPHIFAPWMYGAVYDRPCNICGHIAAWNAGMIPDDFTYLCDCCAEDWHQWCCTRPFKHDPDEVEEWERKFKTFKETMLNKGD